MSIVWVYVACHGHILLSGGEHVARAIVGSLVFLLRGGFSNDGGLINASATAVSRVDIREGVGGFWL